jgi:AmmeMemoRadiSam system protein B
MKLPAGWYPRDKETIDGYLSDFFYEKPGEAAAVVAPHAGWFFSGKIAAQAIAALKRDMETVIVAGGHLPAGAPVLFAEEDAVSTPVGEINIDVELRALVKQNLCLSGIRCTSDNYADNTVEVLLPAVRHFFPESRLLWLRVGADKNAFTTGVLTAKAAAELGRKAVMIGSTDLTHYGVNYDFYPKGIGLKALDWVKKVNDKRFIEAVVSAAGGDEAAISKTLELALNEKSACSAGAVVCAIGFASQTRVLEGRGAPKARLIAYTTSADIIENSRLDVADGGIDSFVAYMAMALS